MYFSFFQDCDIAVNWSGGLHHAKKFEVINNVFGGITLKKSVCDLISALLKKHDILRAKVCMMP